MKRNSILIVFIAGLLVACGQDKAPAQAQTQSSPAADRILAAYRVRGMLGQAEPIISDALLANLPAAVSKQERELLQKAVSEAYAPEKLLAQVSQNLNQAAKESDHSAYLTEAAQALESDLAQRMVALDDAAASDEFADAFSEFLKEPIAEGSDERMQKMQALVEDLRLVELQTVFNIGMMRGMIVARNAASPEDYSMSQESADRMVKQTREGLQEHLNEQVPVMLFFAYREVEAEKLAEYVSLQDSEALQWVNQAMVKAIGSAFASAAQNVPKRYNELAANESA